MPVLRYVIFRRLPDGAWAPIEAFDPDAPLRAERRVDALAAEQPGAYRLWVFTTAGHRLLRDTEQEG